MLKTFKNGTVETERSNSSFPFCQFFRKYTVTGVYAIIGVRRSDHEFANSV